MGDSFSTGLVVAAAGVLGALVLGGRLYFQSKIGHILTGQQRRAAFPLEEGLTPGTRKAMLATDIFIKRNFVTVAGETYFYQTIEKGAPSHVLVFFHGYSSNCDLYVEPMSEMARRGALVLMFDLPSHGRSDGLYAYIASWWDWVARIWEILDTLVPQVRSKYPSARKVFAAGMSLGGGLVACLAHQRPNFFDGIVMAAPMLAVAPEVKPPKIVCDIFKYVLGPLKLTWPLSPSKSLTQWDFRVEKQGYQYEEANPISMKGQKPRLATALSLAFTFPEWMEEHMSEVRVPFLLLHGTSDKITSPEMSKKFHEVAASTDKTLKLLPGAYHCEVLCCTKGQAEFIGTTWQPEQEKCTQEVLTFMGNWMDARL